MLCVFQSAHGRKGLSITHWHVARRASRFYIPVSLSHAIRYLVSGWDLYTSSEVATNFESSVLGLRAILMALMIVSLAAEALFQIRTVS